MKLIKNIASGEYVIKYGIATLAKFRTRYVIQGKLPLFGGVRFFYEGTDKPKYRNLLWYSILTYLYLPVFAVAFVFVGVIYLTGRGLYTISKLLLTISYLLMLMPNSAKHEFSEILEVWGKDL